MKTNLNEKQDIIYTLLKQGSVIARERFRKWQDKTYQRLTVPFGVACDRITYSKLTFTFKWKCACATSEDMLASALTEQVAEINNNPSYACLVEIGSVCNNPYIPVATPFFVTVKMLVYVTPKLTKRLILLRHRLGEAALKTLDFYDAKSPNTSYRYTPDVTLFYAKSIVFKWKCSTRILVSIFRKGFEPIIEDYNTRYETEVIIETHVGYYGTGPHTPRFVQVRQPNT